MIDLEIATFNDLYWDKELSYRMVAEELGVTASQLKTWIRKHKKAGDISLRDRSEALKNAARHDRNNNAGENNPNYKHGIYHKLHNKKGIYMLYNNTELVYIGKATKSIRHRVASHNSIGKDFNKVVAYFIKSDADIHVAEMYLINKHKPRYNLADISCDDLSFDIDMLNIVSHKMITIEVSQMARWDKTK